MKITKTYIAKVKLFFLALAIVAPVAILLFGEFSSSRFEVTGAVMGICWMLHNFFGFLFGRDMSMRGSLPKANSGDDSSVRRTLTFWVSLIIYLMLIYYLAFA